MIPAGGAEENANIAFAPLAMPLMCGPGAIATIIGITSKIKHASSERNGCRSDLRRHYRGPTNLWRHNFALTCSACGTFRTSHLHKVFGRQDALCRMIRQVPRRE